MSKVRVTLDLSPHLKERLDRLEKATDASSRAEVIRQALQVYEYIVGRMAEGCSFQAVSPSGREETVVIPGITGPGRAKNE